MAQNYRVIRVKEEVYIKIKEFQLELLKQSIDGKTPSMSETLEVMITKKSRGAAAMKQRSR